MAPTFYWTLLACVFVYALWRGGSEHRIAAIGCVLATFASRALRPPSDAMYGTLELGLLLVDLSLFALFLALALRSSRFWPLWIAGFHLVALTSHAFKAIKLDLIPSAYAVAAQFWSYPVLLCIALAVWRAQRRRLLAGETATTPAAAA